MRCRNTRPYRPGCLEQQVVFDRRFRKCPFRRWIASRRIRIRKTGRCCNAEANRDGQTSAAHLSAAGEKHKFRAKRRQPIVCSHMPDRLTADAIRHVIADRLFCGFFAGATSRCGRQQCIPAGERSPGMCRAWFGVSSRAVRRPVGHSKCRWQHGCWWTVPDCGNRKNRRFQS